MEEKQTSESLLSQVGNGVAKVVARICKMRRSREGTELARFVERFGNCYGSKYFEDGLSYEQALAVELERFTDVLGLKMGTKYFSDGVSYAKALELESERLEDERLAHETRTKKILARIERRETHD
jgi:hypothetical protein